MSIRNAAKAVIERNGEILLQHCQSRSGYRYYELPGGGQNAYETMEEAVLRECLEETGYTVSVERFLALYEEIWMDPAKREAHPDHTHRIYHVFLCHPTDTPPVEPAEADWDQIGMDWVPLSEIAHTPLRPAPLRAALEKLLSSTEITYLGYTKIEEHGK